MMYNINKKTLRHALAATAIVYSIKPLWKVAKELKKEADNGRTTKSN